jgi:hypothetical protein
MEFRKADLGLLKEAVTKAPSPLDNSRQQREVENREREEQANVRVRAALMFGEMMVMEEREKRLRAEGRADALDRLANGKLDEMKGLIQSLWDWFRKLTGWPGRKRRKETAGLVAAREIDAIMREPLPSGERWKQEAACREYLKRHANPFPTEAEVSRLRNRFNEYRKAGKL